MDKTLGVRSGQPNGLHIGWWSMSASYRMLGLVLSQVSGTMGTTFTHQFGALTEGLPSRASVEGHMGSVLWHSASSM